MMSGNNEEIDTYAAQIMVIMNTKEATAHFWACASAFSLSNPCLVRGTCNGTLS